MTTRVDSFLTTFFGPGNDIRLNGLAPPAKALLAPALDELGRDRGQPVALPRRHDERLTWYVLAFSAPQFRAVREAVTAFVGPSFSDFNGRPRPMDESDAIDAAVQQFCDGFGFCLTVVPPGAQADARESFRLLDAIWKAIPPRGSVGPRPVGRILRDFGMALQARDPAASASHLEEVRMTGRMTASNLTFLKVERLEALERWEELTALPELATLLTVRRPLAVTQALLRAVYHVSLAGLDVITQREEALTRVRSEVLPSYQPLFKSWSGLHASEALTLFALSALASDPPRATVVTDMVGTVDQSERGRLEALLAGVVLPEQPISDPAEALRRGDFDAAFRFAQALQEPLDKAQILLRCAYELDTIEARNAALAVIATLTSTDREELLIQRAHRFWLASLTEAGEPDVVATDEVPTSWTAWLSRIDSGVPFPGALAVANAGAQEWDLTALAADPAQVAQLASLLLAARPRHAEDVVRDALPAFIRFLRRSDPAAAPLKELYLGAAMLVATDDAIGTSDLAVLADLVEDLFEMGVAPSEYRDLIEYIDTAWRASFSPRNMDWCLDSIDCLVRYPSPDEQARASLVSSWIATIIARRVRLSRYQALLLSTLAEELALNEVAASVTELLKRAPSATDPAPPSLGEVRIGIYTLMESAGRRAKEALEELGATKVALNHDTVATDPLKRLAQGADILLVAVRSATHAATDFIDANRPDDKVTLYCSSKGSAGIVRTVLDSLETAPV